MAALKRILFALVLGYVICFVAWPIGRNAWWWSAESSLKEGLSKSGVFWDLGLPDYEGTFFERSIRKEAVKTCGWNRRGYFVEVDFDANDKVVFVQRTNIGSF